MHLTKPGTIRAWGNGILPGTCTPALSQFVASSGLKTKEAWIAHLSVALAAISTDGKCANSLALMSRFREACVFDPSTAQTRVHPALLTPQKRPRVLLIDEPIVATFARNVATRRRQFLQMLTAARHAHPDAEFWFARSGAIQVDHWLAEPHPEFRDTSRRIDPSGSLCASIPYADHVYTVSAPEGFHALLCGVTVQVFGTPWYAGWGLTRDHVAQPSRESSAEISSLFEAAFMRLSRHIDPVTHEQGSLDALLAGIEAHRATVRRFSDLDRLAGIGFQLWKRPFAAPYLRAGSGALRWISEAKQLLDGEAAVLWGGRSANDLPATALTVRIEDGFLHSTGLGSDHVAPYSQVIDRRGIYFDATQPSDLTHILNDADFDEADLARAAALRDAISRHGLTKYNLGRHRPTWQAPTGKRVVLVPGQVADDASIRLGTCGIKTAENLLRQVRTQRPDAFVVYKPHPDVLSGNRQGLIEANELADVVETEADLISLIECADEVHTLSSLSGFEALMRGKVVHTYGLPFYAGWGLTNDALLQPWRKRTLSLNELVAGTLLHYPLYWDWKLGLFTTPEAIVRQLAASAGRPLKRIRGDRLRPLKKAWRWCRNGLMHLLSPKRK